MIPAGGKFAPLHLVDLGRAVGILGSIRGKQFRPLPSRISAARADTGGKMFVDALGHKKLGSVAKLIITVCYPQLVVFFSLKRFDIWYRS